MDLAACLEVLKATQASDSTARKAAEQKLDEAVDNSPNQLSEALLAVMSAGDAPPELRQEAAVIIRQLISGSGPRPSAWPDLEAASKTALMGQSLLIVENEGNATVRRAAGQVVASGIDMASDFEEVVAEFPQLLPELARLVGPDKSAGTRVVVLHILRDSVDTIGDGLLTKGGQPFAMLAASIGDSDAEVRAAGVELLLHLTACASLLDDDQAEEIGKSLAQLMPTMIGVLKGFATAGQEDPLKSALQCMQDQVEESSCGGVGDDRNKVAAFLKETCLEPLWALLLEICTASSETFTDPELQHRAMETAMVLVENLSDDFSKVENQAALEKIVSVNIQWMTRIEEDVSVWTAEFNNEDEEDDCDDDEDGIGQENIDRFGEEFSEHVLMPIIFKLVREAVPPEGANWKNIRAAIMAVAQVVEHITDDSWVEQCYSFIVKYIDHDHPRVRYVVFHTIAQIAYDQEDNLDFVEAPALVSGILRGMNDDNIRVVTNAMNAFTAFGDEVDYEDLEPFLPDLLTKMTEKLKSTPCKELQEACLSAINICAEAAEEDFVKYYNDLMPVLKGFAEAATGEKQSELRGKAFECMAGVGQAVGKSVFKTDADQLMQVLTQLLQGEFAADDTGRKYLHTAVGKIAETLEKDFKPFVPALLPIIFKVLGQKPTEVDAPDSDDEDQEGMFHFFVKDKVMGLRTSAIEEMEQAMELLNTITTQLEEDFCEFMPITCKAIAPLLTFEPSEDIRSEAFSMWEALSKSARAAVDAQRINGSVLQELVNEFLKTVLGAVRQDISDASDGQLTTGQLTNLQDRAVGARSVIKAAGNGVLTSDAVKDISLVVAEVLSTVKCPKDEAAEPCAQRARGSVAKPDNDDSDEENDSGQASRQGVRYCFADVVGAMMRTARDPFREVALEGFIQVIRQFIQKDCSEADRALAFYMADDLVDSLEEHSIKYWDLIMNHALEGITDKSAIIRQYAMRAIGNGARHQQLKPMVRAVALRIHEVMQKQGERHRRRRAVKADAKQTSLAVEAAVRTMGQICEYHEAEFGADAGTAWQLWLGGLPFKYDVEEGQKAHRQLLELVVKNHPILTSPERLPQVLTILADIYKSKFSNKLLDLEIAGAILQVGEAPIKQLCSNIPEKQQKKVEQMLKEANAGAKAEDQNLRVLDLLH